MGEGKFIDRTGEENINNQGLKMKIIEYYNSGNITIEFEDGSVRKNIDYGNFKKGQVKSLYYPTVCNIGYLGEIEKITKKERSYRIWEHMLERCYDKKSKSYPSYGAKGVTVCEEWHCYKNFKDWYDMNVYTVEDERMEIDKDILNKDNKIYSPDNCILVPQRINGLFIRNYNDDKSLPIGIRLEHGKYRVQIRIDKKTKHIGMFDNLEKAFESYKKAKEEYIKEVANEYKDKIPQKLYKAMYNYKVEITD